MTMGEREMAFMTRIWPRSMRLAISTSPSRVSSGYGAHLAEVHADGVVGLLEGAGGEVELDVVGLFACLRLVFVAFGTEARLRR